MAKDPAFLFYTNDFFSGTQFFSDEQVGKFLRLLMAQHQHGHLTDEQMIFICKSYDKQVYDKFKKDENNLWFNSRLKIEIDRRKSYTESRSKNREGKVKPIKPIKKKTSITYEKHMVNENINENKDIIEIESTEIDKKINQFYNFRKELKKPILESSKQSFLNKLSKLSHGNIENAIEILDQSIANGWQGIFEINNKNKNNGAKPSKIDAISSAYHEIVKSHGIEKYAYGEGNPDGNEGNNSGNS